MANPKFNTSYGTAGGSEYGKPGKRPRPEVSDKTIPKYPAGDPRNIEKKKSDWHPLSAGRIGDKYKGGVIKEIDAKNARAKIGTSTGYMTGGQQFPDKGVGKLPSLKDASPKVKESLNKAYQGQ
jgi:hypothetical protein